MIVVANINGNEVVLNAIKKEGKIFILVHNGCEIVDYLQNTNELELVVENDQSKYAAFVDDNLSDTEIVFNQLNENGFKPFEKFTQDLVLVVCELIG